MKTLSNYISEKLVINQQVDEKLLINKNYKNDILLDLIETLNKFDKCPPYDFADMHSGFMIEDPQKNNLSINHIWNVISDKIARKIKIDKVRDSILNGEIIVIKREATHTIWSAVEIFINTDIKTFENFIISFFIGKNNKLSVLCLLSEDCLPDDIIDAGKIEDKESIIEIINFIKDNDKENTGHNLPDWEFEHILNRLK